MKEQFEKGFIPKVRIKQDFKLALRYGIAGGYFKFIYVKNKRLFHYYSKLIEYEGLLKEWDQLDEEERYTWVPQRIPDFSMIDLKALSQTEFECLRISGRYTVREMAEKLNLSSENMKNLLTKMSESYLILFSHTT